MVEIDGEFGDVWAIRPWQEDQVPNLTSQQLAPQSFKGEKLSAHCDPSKVEIPSGSQTWQWKIPHQWRFL